MNNITETNYYNKVVKKHKCDSLVKRHFVSYDEKDVFSRMIEAVDISNYGEAIENIEYGEEGDFWVAHNNEYVTIVKYCPFCGEELK